MSPTTTLVVACETLTDSSSPPLSSQPEAIRPSSAVTAGGGGAEGDLPSELLWWWRPGADPMGLQAIVGGWWRGFSAPQSHVEFVSPDGATWGSNSFGKLVTLMIFKCELLIKVYWCKGPVLASKQLRPLF